MLSEGRGTCLVSPSGCSYFYIALEARLPTYWVPVLKPLYNFILSGTQGPTIWVPGLLGLYMVAFGVPDNVAPHM